MIKLSDYIVKLLEENGVDTVFLVTGGGAMHLNDSFGASDRIRKVFGHHEQGCAIAAEGYARTTGEMAVVNVTTGPGGLNTLTGVMGQWTDSVPVLYISGQVRYDTTVESQKGRLDIRQLGDQEVDIISVVSPLTKFAATIKDPKDVRWTVEKAIYEAKSGRPGPVWVDVPHNIQSAMVDEAGLMGFEPETVTSSDLLEEKVRQAIVMLSEAKRPIVVCGRGTRISGTIEPLQAFCLEHHIPVVTTINNFDAIPDEFPEYAGRIGTVGQRAGNFCLQNADLVLFMGTRNNIRQISYTWKYFCRAAKKIAVEIDYAELRKPFLTYDLPIHADLADFMPLFVAMARMATLPDWTEWSEWCQERRRRFPVVTEEQMSSSHLNPYHFAHELTKLLGEDALVVTGNGTASLCMFQSGIVKPGQRVLINSGCASMGYDIPASIGMAVASGRDTICLSGDGSFQMNLQEMATIAYNRLPVKIFYLDNNGYASIRQTQDNFFHRRYGIGPENGIGFPDTAKLAEAYGIKHFVIEGKERMVDVMKKVLRHEGPALCHVHLDPEHIFEPKLSSEKKTDGRLVSKPLEDMYPFLPRKVLKENMIIDLAPED
ncbi:MAG: acetolactate synthase 2 catalytic subunit [Methanomassiliicoccales archaeon PtaU1.Bin124]|nr:MAG: acetolactate synthase 2 catalytic subunit [Methanomassiliicoccales archaeon PtaU1.Bin124]